MSFVFFKQSLSFIINISSDFSQWSELCRMFRDLIWYHLLLSVFPAAGLQPSQGVHRRPGSAQVHVWGFLEDGLGAEHWNHCYDHKPGGERKSGFIFHQLNMKVSAFLLMFPLIRVPLSLSLSTEEVRPVLADGEQRAVRERGGDAEEHRGARLLHREALPHQEH